MIPGLNEIVLRTPGWQDLRKSLVGKWSRTDTDQNTEPLRKLREFLGMPNWDEVPSMWLSENVSFDVVVCVWNYTGSLRGIPDQRIRYLREFLGDAYRNIRAEKNWPLGYPPTNPNGDLPPIKCGPNCVPRLRCEVCNRVKCPHVTCNHE